MNLTGKAHITEINYMDSMGKIHRYIASYARGNGKWPERVLVNKTIGDDFRNHLAKVMPIGCSPGIAQGNLGNYMGVPIHEDVGQSEEIRGW